MEKEKKEERKNQTKFPTSKLKKMLIICFASKPPSSSSSSSKRASIPIIIPHSKEGQNDPSCNSNFVCEICVEEKESPFRVEGCSHAYCRDCITKYVSYKLLQQGNVSGRIGCPDPGCGGYLEPEYCRPVLPPEVFARWGRAKFEAAFLESKQKFLYCPFKDCSRMILIEIDHHQRACGMKNKVVTLSTCPYCCRMLCQQCKAPWHSGIACSKFQKLNKKEKEKEQIILFMNFAKQKGLKTCPKCKIYIEKRSGCNLVKCRCGTAFCYYCGKIHEQKTDQYYRKCEH